MTLVPVFMLFANISHTHSLALLHNQKHVDGLINPTQKEKNVDKHYQDVLKPK